MKKERVQKGAGIKTNFSIEKFCLSKPEGEDIIVWCKIRVSETKKPGFEAQVCHLLVL